VIEVDVPSAAIGEWQLKVAEVRETEHAMTARCDWATDPAVTFATYTPAPETMTAKHAAPRKTLLERLKDWWRRHLSERPSPPT
jgi:hypothetical protein